MTNKPPDKSNKGKGDFSKKGPGLAGAAAPTGKPVKPGVPPPSPLRNSIAGVPSPDSKPVKPPENSVGIRIVAFGMALTTVCVGNYFVTTNPLMALAYIVALVTGSYMSYINRHTKTSWQTMVVFGGIALVGINCWLELNSGVEIGDFSPFTPAIHFLAGTYVMQSFELRTRTEINTSMMLGLLIVALVAPISKSVIFGGAIFVYLCLQVALFYFDCVSKSAQGAGDQPIKELELAPAQEKKNFLFKGNTVMCLAVFPIVSIMLFLLLPRADNLIDNIYAYISTTFGKNAQTPVMVPESAPEDAKRWSPPKRKNMGEKTSVSKDKGKKVTRPEDKDDDSKSKNGEGTGSGEGAKPGAGDKKSAALKGKEKAKASKEGKAAKDGKNTAPGDAKLGNESDSVGYDDELDIKANASTSNALIMRVRSNRTCFMKMYGFDKYDESGKWTSSNQDAIEMVRPPRGGSELSEIPALLVPSNFPAVQLTQECVIEHDLSRDIPAAWIPKNLDLNVPKVTVDDMGSIRLTDSEGELKKGTKYKVVSTFPVYDLNKMLTAPAQDQGTQDDLRFRLSRYLQMPKDFPDAAVALADQVTASGTSWYSKADKMTNYLRKNFTYSYTKNRTDDQDPLTTFLFDKKDGDCKDFATALAMTLRSVGVPTRVVCGFSPGELNSVTGYHEVRFKNLHSWAEVYIPDHGWVPFDATPAGYMPDKPHEKSYDLDGLKKNSNQELEQLAQPKKDEEAKDSEKRLTWQQIAMLCSGIGVVGVCLFFLVRALIRKLKKERERVDNHPAKKIFKKVELDLKKWKIVRLPHETGVEFARRVKMATRERTRQGLTVEKDFNSVVESFLDNYEAAYYGNKELLGELETLAKRIHDAVARGGKGGAATTGTLPPAADETEPVGRGTRGGGGRSGR